MNEKTVKVTKVDIEPTWTYLWKLWLELGKIDQNTYDAFLPAIESAAALRAEQKEKEKAGDEANS